MATRIAAPASRVRSARVGDRLPAAVVGRGRARRLDASVLLVPGREGIVSYEQALEAANDRFAAWDGRVTVLPPDGEVGHRLVVVDRYGQVYHAVDAASLGGLPSPAELEEWFKFLSTMCPECGVLDDPLGRGWTP